MRTQTRATLLGLSAVLLWSTVASAFKLSLALMDVPQLLFYSGLTSLLVLGLALALTGRLGLVRAASRRDCAVSLGLGLMNPLVYYIVLFNAYDLLPAQVAQPLNYTWAIVLALLSIPLLKQRLAVTDVIGAAVSYFGVVVIATRGSFSALHAESPLGIGLALGSTFVWALYWIASTRDRRDPEVTLFMNISFGLPFVLLYCVLFSSLRLSSWTALGAAGYVGVVEMGLTAILWLRALRLSDNASRIGNLIFLSPFLSLLFIRSLVGEAIRPATVVGLVLVVAGLLVQQSGARRVRSAEGIGDR
jgi:drug/metabolite transporter (DMT)-like permease